MIPGLKKRVFNLHDVYMYLALVQKHMRLMVLIMCFTMMCGLVYFIYARPVYYASGLVRMNYVPLPLDTEKLFADSRFRTVLLDLQSPHIVERTARRFGIRGNARDIQLTKIFKTQYRFDSEKNLIVEVYPVSYDIASQWIPVLIEEYESYRREKHQRSRDQIIESYTRELQEAADRMGESLNNKFELLNQEEATKAQIELLRYKQVPAEIARMSKRIDEMGRIRIKLEDPSLDAVAKLSLINSIETDPLLASTGQLSTGQEVQQNNDGQNNNGDKAGGSVIVVPSMLPSEDEWQKLEKEQQRIKNEMTEKSLTYLPGHRVMQGLQKELDVVHQKLEVEYQVKKRKFDLEYSDLLNKRNDLVANIDQYTKAFKEGERVRQSQYIFSQSRIGWERMIAEMQKKIESLDFAWEKERVDLTFSNMIEVKDIPVSPHRGKLVILCLAAGLALAAGIPFLIEYLDHTMHNLEEVESTFQLRGLGIVPKLEHAGLPTLADREDKKASIIENFRVIRTNLLSMGSVTKAPHVIMITSAMPKEGKTVVSSNLAMSFAQNGQKTLLIDTDLRRGRMHRLFGYRKSPGVSNVLLGEVSIEDACRPTNHENLSVLSAGKHLDTGSELLGSQKFVDLMNLLRERYDRIVVDTPPVLGLSETSILQKLVDGVLFVIWSGHTPIRNMKAAIEMLTANGANFYGFILNRLDLSTTQNYYQYYYYSHDYYYHYSPQAIEGAK